MERCLNCMEIYDERYEVCPHCGFIRGTPPSVASHLMPGTVIADRYIIGTVIGYGGFGITYIAWDIELSLKVAIKEHYPNSLVNRIPGTAEIIILGDAKKNLYYGSLQRFLLEARTIAKFDKEPNIVDVYNFLEANGTAYMVMEYMNGVELKDYVKQFPNECMPVKDAIDIICEVGKALKVVHKAKVIHRDIAPDNIFICKDKDIHVNLYDFGAARLSSEDKTQSMSIVLKPGYAPPEQYRSKSRQGPRTDVYALAATLYKMVTGQTPLESLDRVVEDTLAKPSDLNPKVPKWLDNVILTGMAKNADVRFSNVEKFMDALHHEKKMKTPEQRIKMRRWTRAVTVVIVAAIIGAVSYNHFGMYSDISGEGVPNGSISMWVPVASQEDEDRYKEFDESFEKKFKGKTLEIEYIKESKYKEKLTAAIEEGDAPTIFDGSYIEDNECKSSLNSIFSDVPLRHMNLLKENQKQLKANKMVPMGFTQYVLFENTYLSADAQKSFVENGGVELNDEEDDSDLFNAKKTMSEIDLYEGIKSSSDAKKMFLKEKLTFYIGNVDEKSNIQNKLSGYSDVTEITEDGKSYVRFKDLLSISKDADSKEKRIAKLMIKYGLSEEGQNVLCVRNQGMVPINKSTFDTFTDVNDSLDFIDPKKTIVLESF